MAVPAVLRLVYPLSAFPLEPWSRPQHTGETRCAPLLKPKSMLVLYNTIVPLKLDFAAEKKGAWPSRPC